MHSASDPSGLKFGPFVVDLRAGELRKNGAKIRLQEQPFQVLAALLERAGDVVTRDELRQKVWPADTFVDFDHSLNTAINKIREALGDSASTPRFVETLARRGYRFLVPVKTQGPPASVEALPAETVRTLPDVPTHPTVARSRPALPNAHRGLTRGLFALIQVMYLSFYVSALFRLHAIDNVVDSSVPGWGAFALVAAMLTSGVGIPLRCYLISAVGFDYPQTGEKFRKLFALVFPLDELWAVAPFLMVQKIGIGGAFAATAALLYVPFSERTLVRMAYPEPAQAFSEPQRSRL